MRTQVVMSLAACCTVAAQRACTFASPKLFVVPAMLATRTVEFVKERGVGLGVRLRDTCCPSMAGAAVTVSKVEQHSVVAGMLSPGDALLFVDGLQVKDEASATAALRYKSGRTRLTIRPASLLSKCVGHECATALTWIAWLASCMIFTLCILPAMPYSARNTIAQLQEWSAAMIPRADAVPLSLGGAPSKLLMQEPVAEPEAGDEPLLADGLETLGGKRAPACNVSNLEGGFSRRECFAFLSYLHLSLIHI